MLIIDNVRNNFKFWSKRVNQNEKNCVFHLDINFLFSFSKIQKNEQQFLNSIFYDLSCGKI